MPASAKQLSGRRDELNVESKVAAQHANFYTDPTVGIGEDMRSLLVVTAMLFSASAALADKEDDCLAECDKATDPDIKAVCQRVVKLTDKDGGCFKGKWTNEACCSGFVKETAYQLKRATSDCGGLEGEQAARCSQLFTKECLANAKETGDANKLYSCLNDKVMPQLRAAGLGDACKGVSERDRSVCDAAVSTVCPKESNTKRCVEGTLKSFGLMANAWGLCDVAFDRGACEGAYKACQAKYQKDWRYDRECFDNVAGTYGKNVVRLNEAFVTDDKYDGKPKNIGNWCEGVATGTDLSDAEKKAFRGLCDAKTKELESKRVVDDAASELTMNLLPKIEGDYKPSLEKKAVLSKSTAELQHHGETCLEALKIVQEGRKLADSATLKIHVDYKDVEVTIADARKICQWPLDNLEVYSKAIKEARAKDAAKTISEFCSQNSCKGKAQKTTLDQLVKGDGVQVGKGTMDGTPSKVTTKGGQIYWTWTWGSSGDPIMCSCNHIVFDASGGKVVKKFVESCACASWR